MKNSTLVRRSQKAVAWILLLASMVVFTAGILRYTEYDRHCRSLDYNTASYASVSKTYPERNRDPNEQERGSLLPDNSGMDSPYNRWVILPMVASWNWAVDTSVGNRAIVTYELGRRFYDQTDYNSPHVWMQRTYNHCSTRDGVLIERYRNQAALALLVNGMAFHNEGKMAEAMDYYKRCLAMDPTNERIIYAARYNLEHLQDQPSTSGGGQGKDKPSSEQSAAAKKKI